MDADDTVQDPVSVGLVLSAGGNAAESWHAGVLNALADMARWDARDAELIVGTSAGAVAGLCLRAGVSPADLYARQRGEPFSDEARVIADRVTTEPPPRPQGCSVVSLRPHSLRMTARALMPPQRPRLARALVGLTPRGVNHNDAVGQQMSELHPEPWPSERFWVVAVRLSDGKRVVFGRDDTDVTVWDALRASCAVPCRDVPVAIAGSEYIDGGVHSYVNADLMGPPAFDAVVVSSVAGGEVDWAPVRKSLRDSWTAATAGIRSMPQATPEAARVWMSETASRTWGRRAGAAHPLAPSDGRPTHRGGRAAARQWHLSARGEARRHGDRALERRRAETATATSGRPVSLAQRTPRLAARSPPATDDASPPCCGADDHRRLPRQRLLARLPWSLPRSGAGVVHATSRPVAARIPRGKRRRLDPASHRRRGQGC